jgi:hypothetical protein
MLSRSYLAVKLKNKGGLVTKSGFEVFPTAFKWQEGGLYYGVDRDGDTSGPDEYTPMLTKNYIWCIPAHDET